MLHRGVFKLHKVCVRFSPSLSVRQPSVGVDKTFDLTRALIGFEEMSENQVFSFVRLCSNL